MGTTTQGGAGILATMQGWLTNPWFWIVVGLSILAVILFIWAVAAQSELAKVKKNGETGGENESTYRRRRSKYMPDPGIPPRELLYGNSPVGDTSGYVAGMGQEPDAVLRSSLRQ